MRIILLIILYVTNLSRVIYGQSSFVVEIDNLSEVSPLSPSEPPFVSGSSDGKSVVFWNSQETGDVNLIKLDTMGDILGAHVVNIDGHHWKFSTAFQGSGSSFCFPLRGLSNITDSLSAICVVDFNEQIYWAKQTGRNNLRKDFVGFTQNRKIFSSFYMEERIGSPKLGIALFDEETGEQFWGYHYQKNFPVPYNHTSYKVLMMDELVDQELVALVFLSNLSNAETGLLSWWGIIKLSDSGDFIKGIGLRSPGRGVLLGTDEVGNIYVSYSNDESPYEEESNEDSYAIISKFDKNLNQLWTKRMVAPHFPYRDFKIIVHPDGNILFAYTTYDEIPVISGELSPYGELLWSRGYSFYRPLISIGANNIMYFASPYKYNEEGNIELSPIIAKTLPSGEIESCPQFNACLSVEDIDVEFEDWQWSREDAPPLPDLPVTLDTAYFSSTPYCGTPIPPQADFVLPDTLCQYECVQPDSVQNKLAHYVEWHIKGAQLDTIIADTTFSWCFEEPGHYNISQEIWLLGCSEIYEQSIEVLPDNMTVSLGEDRTICTSKPYAMTAESNRFISSIQWNDGSEAETLLVDTAGRYGVTVTDGYCDASTEVNLQFLEDLITAPPLVLPPDTLICNDFLPYILQPKSPYAQLFYLDDSEEMLPEFSLNKSGTYQVGVLLEGCPIEQEFILETESCEVPIFIPNAFSPNDDGVNDIVTPMGLDFEGISLEVFDRWGGRLFYTNHPPFRWDGNTGKKAISSGVYVMVFHYLNLRNGLEEVVSGEVLLLR